MGKYIIPKGREFYCEFVIKEPGASTPMDLTGATGTFTLTTASKSPCKVLERQLDVKDGLNGIMSLTLSADDTKLLNGRTGFAEDGYPLIPTYAGSLYIETEEHPIDVLIERIYVLEEGEACPAVNP